MVPAWDGPVPVDRLVAHAQARHPSARAAAAALTAAQVRAETAGRWAHPSLDLSYGRTRARQPGGESDQPYGVGLSQRLPAWGEATARRALARAGLDEAEAAGGMRTTEIALAVRRAALDYVSAREAAAAAEAEVLIALELAQSVERQGSAGEADRAAVSRARLVATIGSVQRDAAHRDVATALAVLRIWCGSNLPDGLVLADAWPASWPVVPAAQAQAALARHPQVLVLEGQTRAQRSRLELARQAGQPGITIGIFADREAEEDAVGATLGLELPLWDRGAAGIAEAEAGITAAEAAQRQEQARLAERFAQALGAYDRARLMALALAGEALPAAAEALRLRQAAFAAGATDLDAILDARRSVLAVQTDLRLARRQAAAAALDIAEACGLPNLPTNLIETP